MVHLTDAVVKRLPAPAKGYRVHYDDTPGFGCRVTAAGARSFVLNYVTRAAGRERLFARHMACVAGCAPGCFWLAAR